jgi:uncharacterized protein YerC
MRTSNRKLNISLRNQVEKTFYQLIADLTNPEEVETFLKDFLNDMELEAFTKRMAVAYWLKKGRSYENIKENLKVSTATIASVQNLMKKPGFKLAIKKIGAEEWANIWTERIKKLVK